MLLGMEIKKTRLKLREEIVLPIVVSVTGYKSPRLYIYFLN